jgi:hypothetical protein
MTRLPLRALLSGGWPSPRSACWRCPAAPRATSTELLPGFLSTGLGVGLINPVLANIALSTVPDDQSGIASGTNETFR